MNFPIKKIILSSIIGLMAILISCNIGYSQTTNEKLDELLGLYYEYGKFNGSVLVADAGKVIYKKGYGEANMEWDIPNEANTKHRLGSVTKQFTGMLILQLVAEGKIDLHLPITTYLPDYPKANGDKITTHHLLTHSSGIPNYTAFPGFFQDDSRDPYTPEEFVKVFEDKDLEFVPGEKFNYSNSGYFLLGVLIEKISGKTYEDLLHEKIFTPLGMHDSGYDNHGDILKNRATGYEKSGDGYINSDYLDMSIPYAAGSLYSTVEDLYLWDQGLYTEKLLPQKYLDMFFEPCIPAFGNGQYAYGWIVGKEPIGNTKDSIDAISHGGGINGFNTIISRSITDQSLVVLLNNTGGAPLNQMTRAIRGIMNNASYDTPKKSLANDMLSVIQSKGIKAGIDHFNSLKDSDDYDVNENEINSVGYKLLRENKVKEAAQVFKLNSELFSESFNVYDSYGEALMGLGDNENAIKNYKKSVELNPANQNGIDKLKVMGVDTKDLVKDVDVPEEILISYIGEYEISPGFILEITKEGKQLISQATGQGSFNIFPKSNEEFYVKEFDAQITFNKGKDGKIESLTLHQGGRDKTAKKIGTKETNELVEDVHVPEEILISYIGEYEISPGFILEITKVGKQLISQATGQGSFNIFPKSNEEFYVKEFDAQITFNKGADGKIESLTLHQGGRDKTAKKIAE